MRYAALVLLAALAACGARETTFFERVVQIGIGQFTARGTSGVQRLPSRATLEAIRRPLIALSRADAKGIGLVATVARNRDYVIYQDASRRSVVMKGGIIAATNGFQYDLAAVKHQSDDPVVRLTPVAKWPKALIRNYQFNLRSRDGFEVTATCLLRPGPTEKVEIFERSYQLVRIEERCVTPRRTFTNTYWADGATGFIWKSRQWIGPKVSAFVVEIINPVKPG